MKKVFGFAIVLFALTVQSQSFENKWTGHFSFNTIRALDQGNDKLYVASENAVFTYDFSTRDVETTTAIQGLSGERISDMYYSEHFDRLVIGYESGLIEVVLEEGEILKVVDILEKPTIPANRKRINHLNEEDGMVYIATQYGISVFDLAALEFGDTYFIGDLGTQVNVNQTAVHNGFLYAALDDQTKRGDADNPNLIDSQQWSVFYPDGLLGLGSFNDNLYAIDENSSLLRFDGNTPTTIATFPQQNKNIYFGEDYLTVTSNNQVRVFDNNETQVAFVTGLPNYSYTLSTSLVQNDKIYLGTEQYGVLEVPFGGNQPNQILPEGPIRNDPFALDATAGQVWVVFGEVDLFFNPFPLNNRGMSQYENETWTNIPYEDMLGARSVVHVAINPDDPAEAYASSMSDGLLRIQDKEPTVLYDETNSSLESAGLSEQDVTIRVFGADYDRNGDLWFVQSGPDDALKKRTASGIQSYDITNVIADPKSDLGLNKLKISREGNVFFATSANGVVGYNTTNNIFYKIGEGAGNLPSNNVRTLAFDSRNQLWIGTLKGLRVLYNVGNFFEEGTNREAEAIIILEDDVAQELLNEQSITDIEVDGANNKWISTATSGVFYVSPNGQETLLRFTKENSPLPSNNVRDIAVDPESGVVYFATPNGLIAYKGTATAPSDNLKALRAFPNPVRPNFNGNVTIDGLTERANVKITDVNGNLVFEEISEGGSIQWDTTAFGKYKVASGVYFILATTDDAQETKIAKVMIVR